ncbi:MAG: hypothetical protein ACR2OE_15295 [Thermomicrobiales bacterium]
MLPNHARGSAFGSISQNGWLTSFGGRLGRNTGTSPTAQFAVSGFRNNLMGDLLGVSGTFTVSTLMTDNASGSDYTSKATTPVMIGPGAPFGDGSSVGLLVRASGASIGHGQDNSGWMMYEDTFITGFADTWTPDNNRPEGKMSLWAEVTNNRPPATPSNLSPVANGRTTDSTPDLACDFRDPDEVLPGFALGQGDKVKKYLFEVWNTAKTTRIATSGITTASGPQQTARRVSWTCTSTLSPGSYIARATVYDQFDTPSPIAEWTFTVSAGGMAIPTFASGVVLGTGPDGYRVTNSGTPSANVLWQSTGGVSLLQLNVRVLDVPGVLTAALGGSPTPLRGSWFVPKSASPNTSVVFTFAEWNASQGGTTWSALPAGTVCAIQTQGIDANSDLTPWAGTEFIKINAAPNVPTSLSPVAGASFADFPVLSATTSDATDPASTLKMVFNVRLTGGSATATYQGAYDPASGRWSALTAATGFPSIGTYEWQAQATDPWGFNSSLTAWTAINYVTPPTIVITSPTADQAMTYGNPDINWTVDRTQTTMRQVFTEVDSVGSITGEGMVYDTGTISTSLHATGTPTGKFHNARRYRLDLTLGTSDGLVTTVSRYFSIQYPAPTALSSITAAKTQGPFEHASDPGEWSRITVTWAAATTVQVADIDFGGYLLRRVNLGTQESVVLAHTLTRDATVFIDRTPVSGVAYEYRATYLKRVNTFDLIESVAATAQQSVTLKHSTIFTMDDDDFGCPLRYWEERNVEWVNDVEIIPTWSDKPIIFTGLANSSVISGSFIVMDAPDRTYTARDVVETVRNIARPNFDADGYPAPRVVCYRDPRQRLLYAVLTSGSESDDHSLLVGRMDLVLNEIAQDQGVDSWI